jgi:hypothetical protein
MRRNPVLISRSHAGALVNSVRIIAARGVSAVIAVQMA